MHGDARLRRIFIFICNVSSPLMYKRGKDCLPQAPSTRGRVDDVTPAQELHVVFFAKGKLSLFDRFLPALLSVLFFQPAPSAALAAPSSQTENPDTVCAKCHQVIYNSYQKTPMAQASGEAMDGLVPGEFTHAACGVHYRLFIRDGREWLSYDRPNPPAGRALMVSRSPSTL